MDSGAWWAAVYGVTQSQTQLKRLAAAAAYESGTWSTLAVSEPATYNDLVNAIAPAEGGYTPHYVTPWNPAAYVVPEPSSGLLVLVGAALLALRRRKRRAHG